MRPRSPRFLYFLLALYVCASMTYLLGETAAFWDKYFRQSQHILEPFDINADFATVTTVTPDAGKAGLHKGDVIESLDGRSYTGYAQLIALEREARPGETMSLVVRGPSAVRRTVSLHLVRNAGPRPRVATWLSFASVEAVPSFICLLVGYWVVAARPRDPNAWLILVLLSFLEVLFSSGLQWWPGRWMAFEMFWFQTLQIAGPIALLLFGIYFPERWRFDRRAPWAKWILILPSIAGWFTSFGSLYIEYLDVALGKWSNIGGEWMDRIINPINLACVVVYWIAIFDKLRSASTADARRRMRVLCAGSVIGLGTLLIAFVLVQHVAPALARSNWFGISASVLTLVFPFTLAYVVVVQRALDVRILLRMGTKYLLARMTVNILVTAALTILGIRIVVPLSRKEHITMLDLIPILAWVLAMLAVRFFKLRNRMDDWLNRKFFREAYQAEVVLSELSEQARRFTEKTPLLETVSRRISEVLHVPQIGVLLRGGNVFQLQQAVGLNLSTPIILPEHSRTVQTLEATNRPATVYRESRDGWLAEAAEEEKRALDAVNAEVVLPLSGRERLVGLMTLGPKRSEEPYSPSDLRLLQSVATQTGLALEVSELARSLAEEAAQRERINREIEIAREVQERLFPQEIPQVPGISLAGACRPAQGVGGDYYDFIQLEDGRIGLAIGDVSGKGISAALLMASLRASLRGMALEGPRDLAKVMQNVNRLVYESSASHRYATFFFATYEPATCELRYVNAGHNAPVILRGAEQIKLEAGGLVVGLMRDATYEQDVVRLQPGDTLVAYTDGVSEAMTAQDEEWGEEQMIATAERARGGSADGVLRAIVTGADAFTAGAPQHDDMTLLVLKLEPSRSESEC